MYHERICISVAGPDRGTVYLWRPGVAFETEENEQTYEYLYPAARSFTEFWNSLYPNPNPIFRGSE